MHTERPPSDREDQSAGVESNKAAPALLSARCHSGDYDRGFGPVFTFCTVPFTVAWTFL